MRSCLLFLSALVNHLRDQNQVFKLLKPEFVLVGSVAEGTRLDGPTELDLSVTFEGMKSEYFCTNECSALGLGLTPLGAKFFEPLALSKVVGTCVMFDMLRFKELFLSSVLEGLLAVQQARYLEQIAQLQEEINELLKKKNT